MTLYEILEKIELGFDEETGEIYDDSQLEELALKRDEKIDVIANIYKDRLGDAKKIDENIKALTARKKQCEREAEGAKRYLENMLQGAKFKSPQNSISYRKSVSVQINDVNVIPTEFWRVKAEVDKESISKALKAGKEVTGAELVEKNNMQIR